MPDAKDTALTENTSPLGSDLERMIDDPGGSPLTQKIYKGSNNLLPDGYMINGKLAVTVSSNNITVALKTKSGGDPSTTDPVSVYINGTYRRCTAALSVTKNAGTNWCNAGSSELATKEVDYFVYLIQNTTPATDIMDLGFSRYPAARVYSDFSGTSTNEKYLASSNASAPTSTDDCVVIGRFAATLSAGAGYTWTVPTFTNANLIQTPIYETRWLDWAPVFDGFSADPTSLNMKYKAIGKLAHHVAVQGAAGTSDATNFTMTLALANTGPAVIFDLAGHTDNSADADGGVGSLAVSNTITFYKTFAGGAWTGSGTKRVPFFEIFHQW